MCQIPKHREEGRLIEGERRKTNTVEDVQPEGVEEKQLEKKVGEGGGEHSSFLGFIAQLPAIHAIPLHVIALLKGIERDEAHDSAVMKQQFHK